MICRRSHEKSKTLLVITSIRTEVIHETCNDKLKARNYQKTINRVNRHTKQCGKEQK